MPHVTLHAHCLQMASVCWRRPKMKDILQGQQYTFTVMCWLSFERLGWNFTIIVMGSVYKHCDLGCNGPIIRGGLYGKQINFTVLTLLPFEGIS